MKRETLEPGLLPVFRSFVGLQVGFFVLEGLHFVYQHKTPPHPLEAPQTLAALNAILLVYLLWPRLERRLRAAYLPIALCFAFIMPLTVQIMTLHYGAEVYVSLAEELGVLLIFPLLLISWQYRFRVVVVLSLATALVDRGLALWVSARSGPLGTDYIGFLVIRMIMCLTMGYAVSRLMTAQREQRRALRRANAELVHYASTLDQLATSRERNRLARDLHDTLAHTLSGIAVQLEAVKTLWDTDSAHARVMLEQSLAATRTGLTETRRALQALRVEPLQDLGLVLVVRTLAESVTAQTGAMLVWQGPDTANGAARMDNLSQDVEQCIYRVAQESLANVARHAGAKHVTVQLAQLNGCPTLRISDDGCGFDVNSVDADQHLGLRGMRERAELAGGRLEVTSQPSGGTTVCLIVEESRDPSPDL
jgi:signal transduction histidine kinase